MCPFMRCPGGWGRPGRWGHSPRSPCTGCARMLHGSHSLRSLSPPRAQTLLLWLFRDGGSAPSQGVSLLSVLLFVSLVRFPQVQDSHTGTEPLVCAGLWVTERPHPGRGRVSALLQRGPCGAGSVEAGAVCHLGGRRWPVKGDCMAAGNYVSCGRLLSGRSRPRLRGRGCGRCC